MQHMLHQLADNGIMASVFPHGVLFRGGAEGIIREYLIQEMNVLDAVIGLPANIFYGKTIPTCIVVLKKCREQDDNIVFIDASGADHFTKVGNQNELNETDVTLIVETYRKRETLDKYSYVAILVSCHAYYDVYFSYIYQKNYAKVQGYINTARKSRLDVHY